MEKKIGFIGLGNMAEAMIGGMLRSRTVNAGGIIGSAKTEDTCRRIENMFHIEARADNREAARQADILFLAVKPHLLQEVIGQIRDCVDDGTLVVSIAAGKSLAFLEEAFGKKTKLVRCMPNTPALVGEGCTAVCCNDCVPQNELQEVMGLLRSFGKADLIPERLIDAFIGVSGSAPAYVFMFIEALSDAGVAAGLPRNQAYEFGAQAVLGSAKMVLETGRHPGELKDMVCSPAGTTIEAVKVLEQKGLRAAVLEAVEACVDKAGRL